MQIGIRVASPTNSMKSIVAEFIPINKKGYKVFKQQNKESRKIN
jgi:hypothetical protein